MTMAEIEREELAPNQGVMAVMGKDGDTKITWDRTRPVEVEEARRTFNSYRDKGYVAYKLDSMGDKGEVIRNFDPEAQRVVFAPAMVGG